MSNSLHFSQLHVFIGSSLFLSGSHVSHFSVTERAVHSCRHPEPFAAFVHVFKVSDKQCTCKYLTFLVNCCIPEQDLWNAMMRGGCAFTCLLPFLPTFTYNYKWAHKQPPTLSIDLNYVLSFLNQAWWMTDMISTDVWGRWIKMNGEWNYTDLPTGSHYPQGKAHTCTWNTCFNAHNIGTNSYLLLNKVLKKMDFLQ